MMDSWFNDTFKLHKENFSFQTSAFAPLLQNSSEESIDDLAIIPRRHLGVWNQLFITSVYIFGIGGNLSALLIIVRRETKRFQKQTLMIKCLSFNDLTALVGSCVLMYVKLYMPAADPRWVCAFRVVLRAFGLGSGCVAVVMALDRWLALTHPFTYQKHITQSFICRTIAALWTFNALLVCAPFLGFGLWFDGSSSKPCVRYRFGTSMPDRTYAYVVFLFGINMCLCIVCCNLSVIRVLCSMGTRMVSRRYSRSSSRSTSSTTAGEGYNHSTYEELSFARLMALLSIFFVICWAPQLLTIIAAQHSLMPKESPGYRAADILIAFNFTLDPYIYVIFRRQRLCKSRRLTKLGSILNSRNKEVISPKRSIVSSSVRSSHTSPKVNKTPPPFPSRDSCSSSSGIQRRRWEWSVDSKGPSVTNNSFCSRCNEERVVPYDRESYPLQCLPDGTAGEGVCSPSATPRVSIEENSA